MKKLFTLLVLTLTFVVGAYAQNEVHIVQEAGTTVVNLDEVRSIELTDEPWSSWEYTSGVYNFSLYVSGAYPIQVLYREHLADRTKMQFLFQTTEIGTKEDLLVDVDKETGACQVDIHDFLDNKTYGPVFVSDLPHNPFDLNKDGERETYEENPCTYNPQTGLFTLNLVYFVYTGFGSSASGTFGNGVETIQLDGFYVPDYSFDISYQGAYIDDNGNEYAVIQAVKGVDISKYQITVATADSDLDAIVAGMKDGSVDCQTMTESSEIKFPIHQSGEYAILAVTYDENEQPVSEYSHPFEFWLGGDNPWESLGYEVYTEDCLTTFFNVANVTYPVEVRQHKDYPGLFRIIHPYEAYGADTSKEYFIEIDATDPEAVIIPGVYGTGFDAGYGEISITSMAYYYMATQGATKEDVKDAGYTGVLEENVITFPVKSLLISMADYQNGSLYSSNNNGMFKLDMSNMTQGADAPAKAKAFRGKLGKMTAVKLSDMPAKTKVVNKPALVQGGVKQNANLKALPPVKMKMVGEAQKAVLDI